MSIKYYNQLKFGNSFPINITKELLEDILKRNSFRKDDLYYNLNHIIQEFDVDYIQKYLQLIKEAAEKAISFLKPQPKYVDIKYLITSLLSTQEYKQSLEEFFPVVVYVSDSSDKNTIGILIYLNGKLEMFEGNDEASTETIDYVNSLLNSNTKVKVFGSHDREVVNKIITTKQLPLNLYVSPKRDHAESYWGSDRVLFSGEILESCVSKESEVDWRVYKECHIEKVKTYN